MTNPQKIEVERAVVAAAPGFRWGRWIWMPGKASGARSWAG